ncbi:hypothetical protein AX15_004406 [Amanita polypyramis BW_CC]|nr:hypothetical protein AX15_004406 [Amanita polypyramis BW_CC]
MPDLSFVAAPMVNQSDLPFRLLTRRHGSTMTYTQMLLPEKLLNNQEYLEHHIRDLTVGSTDPLHAPVVVQLCGNQPDIIVQAGRKLQNYCTAIDLNLGCPQECAREGHYGAYLLPQKDWPLLEDIVSSMRQSLAVPVSAKLRLCQPVPKTLELAQRLEHAGASWITLHARTISARRRRRGAADLSEVKNLKQGLGIPVISNGNVRIWQNLEENLTFTGADGFMVGETLLGNPYLFSGPAVPDPVDIALEYLSLCKEHPNTVPIKNVQTHIKHYIDFQCSRRPWFNKFRSALSATASIEEIEHLLRVKVRRWRGKQRDFVHELADDLTETNPSHESDPMGSRHGPWNPHQMNSMTLM